MTFKAMGCTPEETARRQDVCARLNVLWGKREKCTDDKTRMRIDRKIDAIRRQEAPWMRDAAYFLY